MSHLAWIDTLPTQWQAKPLRAVAAYVISNVDKISAEDEIPVRLCNYSEVYNNEFITLDLDFMQGTASREEIVKFGLKAGDVIITKDSESWDDIGVPALIRQAASDLVCGYHLALLRPHEKQIDSAFLLRCLQAKPVRVQLELAANGVTRFGLPKSDIGSMKLPIPPLVHQKAITRYLDREMARLDAFIAVKERLLDLLAEKRRALITQAVTRGLDPKVSLRDSGIPWLGKIPAHWEIKRGKWFFIERDERSIEGEEALLSLRMERGLVPHNEVSEKRTRPEELVGYKRTSPGELVINRMRAAIGLVAVTSQEGVVSPDYAVFIPVRSVCMDYYLYLFTTQLLGAAFRSASTGMGTGTSGFLRLYSESFLALWFPFPPTNEQKSIVEFIIREIGKLDATSTTTKRTIALIRERRAALIAAAVTGKIEITSAA